MNDNTYDNDTVNYYLGWIDDTPTADVVPVVREMNDKRRNCSAPANKSAQRYLKIGELISNYSVEGRKRDAEETA